jgi:xylulose-5-phosphate/fructose-6-phosphate phosphoketolase
MPDQYQTPPAPSALSASEPLGQLAVSLDTANLPDDVDIKGLLAFQRVANYLSAAQIFLQSNALLQHELTHDDVKPRLLGHWGTCPGLTLVYAHGSHLITRHARHGDDIQMLYITGPGHGAPSILSTLFIEVRLIIHS